MSSDLPGRTFIAVARALRAARLQAIVIGNSPDAFRAEIARELSRFRRAVEAAKIEVN